MQIEREYRSLPLWLAREYLVELGGTAADDNHVQGSGWHVLLKYLDPISVGALQIYRLQMLFTGEDAALTQLLSAFEKKALRAGG